MRRLSTASMEISADAVTRLTAQSFAVQSDTMCYTVQFAKSLPSCECADWDSHYLPCKHMLAALTLYGWNLLPLSYSQFVLFVLDEAVVGPVLSDDGDDGGDGVMQCSADIDRASRADDAAAEPSDVSADVMAPVDNTDNACLTTAKLQSEIRQCHGAQMALNVVATLQKLRG